MGASDLKIDWNGRLRRLFLNCSADQPEVLAEAERLILRTPRQVLPERRLIPEAPARAHFAGLSTFRCSDHLCSLNDIGQPLARKEDRTIRIARNQIFGTHHPISHASPGENVGRPSIESLRSGGQSAQGENRPSVACSAP